MTRPIDYDKAAAILVDAAYGGDEAAAAEWGVSERTVKRYRARMGDDPRLALTVREKRALVEQDWAAALPETIRAAAEFIQRAAKQGNPRDVNMVHAVAGGMKLVAEVHFAKQMLDARLAQLGVDVRDSGQHRTDRPQITAVAAEDGEFADADDDSDLAA